MSFLLNPKKYDQEWPDQKTKDIMLKTIEFFERKGLKSIKEDDQALRWYDDFVRFIKENEIFATLLTPAGYGDADSRFDLSRVCQYNEILGFYGNQYQYAYQVSILGVGPVWMGDNEGLKHKLVGLLKDGGLFAFGLSEKEHGADLYSNEMKLYPQGDGTYKADGSKYYIGNGNVAALVSVHGRYADSNEHAFFAVDSQHHNYKLVKKINTPGVRNAYVAEFELVDYPITKEDIMSSGQLAWDSSLSSVNIGKFQLGFCSVGICTHALYEAITHTSNRILYGKPVTNFPHIKTFFVESFARLNAMKLYGLRSLDYFRAASNEDRRYLLFNPIQKMKVTREGIKVIDMLLDAVTAKGFEQDTYFEAATREVGMIPRLEGTVHVNINLVIKFLQNYFFNPVDYPVVPKRDEAGDDTYVFQQYTGGLAKVRFPDYRLAYEGVNLPNVNVFKNQIELFKDMMSKAAPTPEQAKRVDYMLAMGEMFTLIVYAQLILENCKIYKMNDDLIDQMFNFMVRDFSGFALNQLTNFENSAEQKEYLRKLVLTEPAIDPAREMRIWNEQVSILDGAYEMNP